jgi:hypothetical protein
MGSVRHFRRYAARCLQEARVTLDSPHKAFLVEMAQASRNLAEHAAVAESNPNDRLTDFRTGPRRLIKLADVRALSASARTTYESPLCPESRRAVA